MHTKVPGLLLRAATSGLCGVIGFIGTVAMAVTLVPERADAQAVYRYSGRPFTLYSCTATGVEVGLPIEPTAVCADPAGPDNPYTSYSAGDRVTGTLTLSHPLPANLVDADVFGLYGLNFDLVLSDGRQTLSLWQTSGYAIVSTDADGRIIAWNLGVGTQTGFIQLTSAPNAWVDTSIDIGILGVAGGIVATDFAYIAGTPGTWTLVSVATPADLIRRLIARLTDPALGLTQGQIGSLTEKLQNALNSLNAGLLDQAINQLKAFINEVEAGQTPRGKFRIDPQTAATLIAAADEIIALIGSASAP